MVIFTCIFGLLTIILTAVASTLLTVSLISNEWEYLSYPEDKVRDIAHSNDHNIQWFPSNLGRLEMENSSHEKGKKNRSSSKTVVYLIPAHGGVHKLCADVSDTDREQMLQDGYQIEDCISYLSNEKIISKDAWLDRMRNLAMSCAMVSLILLACSAPLGLLGLLKKQISTIMVTGVMYVLAAVFGIFNLAFMHFKRVKPDGFYTSTVLDSNLPEEYMKTRIFTVGWPFGYECAGLCLCLLASLFWLILAKIYRFQIMSPA